MKTNSIQISKNWINGKEVYNLKSGFIEKYNPHSGKIYLNITNSSKEDVNAAIKSAKNGFKLWSKHNATERGKVLLSIARLMDKDLDKLAKCIAIETGKPPQDAIGEVKAAIAQAEYFSGEGMRLYSNSLTSSIPNKHSHTIREPIGIAGLIVPSNTPIANIAWKTFPALICGNSVVLKSAEDSPSIAIIFAKLCKKAGLPDGVFNVIQGEGKKSGSYIVDNSNINVISFTGSTEVGKLIAEKGGKRLARISLELGGKNPFVVCDDADIDQAVHWALLSAFSNAGQRCAAASRIIVFSDIYEEFKTKFIIKAKKLKLGISSDSDLGPVINNKQLKNIMNAINIAKENGANILCGGYRPRDKKLRNGYYLKPTLIEDFSVNSNLNNQELFGPVTTISKVKNLNEAIKISNSSKFGLTSAIHTKDIDKAIFFAKNVKSGVANINLGTYGSEPHMPFGGFGESGNGTREPGVEALDVYSEIKNISILTRVDLIK